MSATLDDNSRAEFGESLIKETVDKLAGWLVKDSSVVPGTTATMSAEFLTLYYLFVMAARRGGVEAMAVMLSNAHEIARHLADDE